MSGRDCETQFSYEFQSPSGRKCSVSIAVEIPFPRNINEFSHIQMTANSIPVYMESDFISKLTEFIEQSTKSLLDFEASQQLQSYFGNPGGWDGKMEDWSSSYQKQWLTYSRTEEYVEENSFSDVYLSLMHSPSVEMLLQLEHNYSVAVQQMVASHKPQLRKLEDKHTVELQEAMKGLGVAYSDADITKITQRHVRERESLESTLSTELRQLQESQRREYRDWLTRMHSDLQRGMDAPGPTSRMDSDLSLEAAMQPRMEESFTIHLGAQMKTMHNLRLICCDTLDLCKHGQDSGSSSSVSPLRLHTALSLYSSNLSAVVLLVDDRVNSLTGNKEKFAEICRQSTDFHFADIDSQLEGVRELATHVKEKREMFGGQDPDSDEAFSSPSSNSATTLSRNMSNTAVSEVPASYDAEMQSSGVTSGAQTPSLLPSYNQLPVRFMLNDSYSADASAACLQPGDLYITCHSNLSEAHMVLHLVVNEVPSTPIISSRHPIMAGLRNCLRTANRHSIALLTLPLLLVDKLGPEHSMNWCLKRAEVVFKCVKGYMLESSSGNETSSTVVQFLLPLGITDDLFYKICELLPQVFRMTTARNLKATKTVKPAQSKKVAK